MTSWPATPLDTRRDEIECVVAALEPLAGSFWLATDLTTLVHWTVAAGSISPVSDTSERGFCRAFGLVTICDPKGEPVFLINERDTIGWVEPERILAVRELGEESCEIRLERLDDLDARPIGAVNLACRADSDPRLRTIAIGRAAHLQVYDDQLPTGDDDVDALLGTIETTIDARRRLFGPAAGTLDVMEQLERDLDATLRTRPVRSYIWAAVLREQIASMRQSLAV